MAADFGKQLDRLRRKESGSGLSISDQLRLLADPPRERVQRREHLTTMPLPDGEEVTNASGSHYLIRTRYPADHYQGRVSLAKAGTEELRDLLQIARQPMESVDLERIGFLDTETTGISGGAGMCPFLIGIGYFRRDRFEVIQYFIRDFDEESSMLTALAEFLSDFDILVTYNGRSFDVPLVENRCVLARQTSPFPRMTHLDLLFIARRLWRAGHGSCKLTALEQEILRFRRGPDIPGAMIPRAYFDYLESGDAITLKSVFSHHVDDIVSLAALTIEAAALLAREPLPLDDPIDVYSIARIFDSSHREDRSVRCYEAALAGDLPIDIRVRVMERLSVLHRRRGNLDRSMELCGELMVLDHFSLAGYEGAAIIHEHQERDLGTASTVIRDALGRLEQGARSRRTGERLRARLDRLSRKAGDLFGPDGPTGPRA